VAAEPIAAIPQSTDSYVDFHPVSVVSAAEQRADAWMGFVLDIAGAFALAQAFMFKGSKQQRLLAFGFCRSV
jgi:hypothetical protein